MSEIVFGKFLGGLALVLLMVVLSGVFGGLLLLYGNPEIPLMLSGYLALALMATVFLAIGTLVSSFTDNVVIAYVGALFPEAIWYHQPRGYVIAKVVDGLVWGVLTGVAFGWLGPR